MQLLSPILGKKKCQVIFEQLHQISLKGMNIGGSDNPRNSGEVSVMKYIKNKLYAETKIIIFDVGANVGRYSLLLQDVFQGNCSIHAFEPSKSTFQKLLLNIKNKENINLNNFGFGDENKKMMLYYDFPGSGLASVYERRLEKHDLNKNEEIEIKTIDSYCNDNNIKHIHFCKLDVEGHESEAIKEINFSTVNIESMLVEVYTKELDLIFSLLSPHFNNSKNVTNYNQVDNPYWDGTHNDYFFW